MTPFGKLAWDCYPSLSSNNWPQKNQQTDSLQVFSMHEPEYRQSSHNLTTDNNNATLAGLYNEDEGCSHTKPRKLFAASSIKCLWHIRK